jgi:Skp family chaperone for outer membrane proteins
MTHQQQTYERTIKDMQTEIDKLTSKLENKENKLAETEVI